MIRRITVLILFLALSSPPMAVAHVDGMCVTAKSLSAKKIPATGAHACCATAEAPDTCATGTLAMSCCSLEPAPFQEIGAGALPAYSLVNPDLPDFTTPLRGPYVVEPVAHGSSHYPELDTSRSPPPLRALFCTYLI